MANDDLRFMPAADLAAAIARRKVSPVDAVKAVLDAIDDTKTLNAWVTVDADAALKAARAAERAAMRRGGGPRGRPRGALRRAGPPFSKSPRAPFRRPPLSPHHPRPGAPPPPPPGKAGGG